jgi:hypothetical protein
LGKILKIYKLTFAKEKLDRELGTWRYFAKPLDNKMHLGIFYAAGNQLF